MKKKRKAQFEHAKEEFTRERNRLLLGRFELQFSRKKPKSKHSAVEVHVSETRNVAVLYLNDSFYAATAKERRHYVIHELLHLHVARLDYMICDVRSQLPPNVWSVHYTALRREMELLIDALADVIAPLTLAEDEHGRSCEQEASKGT